MYDLAVIGAGPGGYTAAIKAAQMGLHTILFEEDNWGGVCLNKGCVPTKAMLGSAGVFTLIKNAGNYGVISQNASLDFSTVIKRRNDIVKHLTGGIGSLLEMNGVTAICAHAELVSPYCINANGENYQTRNVIFATGSRPAVPHFGGDQDKFMTSDGFFNIEDIPSSVAIIGGGVIGLEFAVMLDAFGTKIAIVEMLESIIGPADDLVIDAVRRMLRKSGIDIYENAKALESTPKGLLCEKDGKQFELSAEKVLLCTGRKPNIDPVMLERFGIKHTHEGIVTDDQLRTNIPNVYAVGDINGKMMLAHTAVMEGIVAAEVVSGKRARMNYKAIPSCIYTTPEIAWVGLTERSAREQYHDIKVSVFPMAANGKSVIADKTEGFVKLIADSRCNTLLGAHLFCDRASDIISEFSLALNLECCAEEIAGTVHPHPTISEACMEAAEGILGNPVNYFVKK
jgi:dihydrolipoamide dehydrogenase